MKRNSMAVQLCECMRLECIKCGDIINSISSGCERFDIHCAHIRPFAQCQIIKSYLRQIQLSLYNTPMQSSRFFNCTALPTTSRWCLPTLALGCCAKLCLPNRCHNLIIAYTIVYVAVARDRWASFVLHSINEASLSSAAPFLVALFFSHIFPTAH